MEARAVPALTRDEWQPQSWNDALPHADPRKITLGDVHLLHALAASIEVEEVDFRRLLTHVDALREKFGALRENR